MPTTTSLEFQRKFGQYLNESHREPVEITRHGRREFVLMSAAQYDELLSAARHSKPPPNLNRINLPPDTELERTTDMTRVALSARYSFDNQRDASIEDQLRI